jgi:hypothetical protein
MSVTAGQPQGGTLIFPACEVAKMPDGRPEIPMAIKRAVLIESGYRCAMPLCRETTLEFAHIEPWSKVQVHEFANIVALCPTDHARFDKGQIDKIAMRQIKANLSLLSHRYTELERRVLDQFARDGGDYVGLEASLEVMYRSLVEDDVLAKRGPASMSMSFSSDDGSIKIDIPMGPELYWLTPHGRTVVQAIRDGQEIV